MSTSPNFEFHISRAARDRYRFEEALFTLAGNVVFANLGATREFAYRMNQERDAARHPERTIHAGALNAMGLIDEVLHAMVARYREQRDPRAMLDALDWFGSKLDRNVLDRTLLAFTDQFPPVAVYAEKISASEWLSGTSSGVPHRAVALEELLMLWLANANPAFEPFAELFDDAPLASVTAYPKITSALRDYFETRPRFGPEEQNFIDVLRAPALASPQSLSGQLEFIRKRWAGYLGESLQRLLMAADVLKEEETATWMLFHPPGAHFGAPQTLGDSSAAAVPEYSSAAHEYEAFTPDVDWMPRTVMIAKSVYVWLDQLSKAYGRPIQTLDQVPDEELQTLARRGFNAVWFIGVWERSRASQKIKQLTGNPDAVASAYSLFDYTIAEDLGGEQAYVNLRDRAWRRGIRLASDMVPNHMGIDSRWMIEHPDWFLSLPYSPFPSYRFEGPDLSNDERVEIKIEDHYYERTDAAVVFRRQDRWTGDTRYFYHGNDGTSYPWNDTAQLNYLKAEVREGLIQTILHVARLFPIIRFDAAMTLTKQHFQRLWFPAPGTGGAIPSRAEHGMTKAEFDKAMPAEFWREVVDRVTAELPGTLLLAEAFWLLEGYFVRTLGMHRVYNSAFMNMLRDEENANYRSVIKNTLEFDPEVLKRHVNFMNNPDERTAVDQFGKGDKYFGICTLLATLPGLPMFGHGQIEGYKERYGMEYRRAYHDESPDSWLVSRHEREISPLLHRRALFAEVQNFLLYDFYTEDGQANEDVFVYSNRMGNERGLVVYHNKYAETRGWVRVSCAQAEKLPDGGKRLRQRTIGEALGLSCDDSMFVTYRDSTTGLEYLSRAKDVCERGLRIELGAYRYQVFVDWRDIHEVAGNIWGQLCDSLAGRGVSSLDDAKRMLELKPVHDALRTLLDRSVAASVAEQAIAGEPVLAEALPGGVVADACGRAHVFLEEVSRCVSGDVGKAIGLKPSLSDIESAGELFERRVAAALKLPSLEHLFSTAWLEEAREVLPEVKDTPAQATCKWATILAWCAMDALGTLHDPADPEHAAAALFDALRLREPMAASFMTAGFTAEESWRAAARVRAAFAHAFWVFQSDSTGPRGATPFSWLGDPDVAWFIGVHEHEGVKYFVKEQFETLLWWMSLRQMLAIVEEEAPDPRAVRALEEALRARALAASTEGYRIEELFESGQYD
ncbi:MAG TPA: alpha-amylase family glycosyl hydrolase [Clostridia bacterium]|nr:alpha-amylase family glycosyl hydrolase [Clostridia bacterium]